MDLKIYEELLFSTPLWSCPITGIDNKEILDYCLRLKKEKEGVQISNRGGWHSKDLIYPLPQNLITLLTDLTLFVNEVCSKHTGITNLELGNFWININGKGDFNMPHDHQNSILSGVYYVSVPEKGMGNLVIHRGDTAEYFLTSKIYRENTLCNIGEIQKEPIESLVYLFPSWVKHHVEPNQSEKERISIAFNFIHPNQK
jgi:uncharacterized protein (TIGR02466 family)